MHISWYVVIYVGARVRLNGRCIDYLSISIYIAAEASPENRGRRSRRPTSYLSGCGAALHTGPTAETGFSFGTAYNIDPESLAAYASYYHSMNPLNAPLSRIPVGVAVSDHQLVRRRSELAADRVDNDYGRQFGIAGAATLTLARDGHGEANLSVVGGFSGSACLFRRTGVLRSTPCAALSRALALNRRLAGLQAERDTFQTMLDRREAAVLLLGEEGTICYCNEAGIQLLRRHDGLAARGAALCLGRGRAEPSCRTWASGAGRKRRAGRFDTGAETAFSASLAREGYALCAKKRLLVEQP